MVGLAVEGGEIKIGDEYVGGTCQLLLPLSTASIQMEVMLKKALPVKSDVEIHLARARSVPIMRRIKYKKAQPNIYIIELYNPPYPNSRRSLRVHIKTKGWSNERLSPNMVKTWTVAAFSKDHAMAELLAHLNRFEGK